MTTTVLDGQRTAEMVAVSGTAGGTTVVVDVGVTVTLWAGFGVGVTDPLAVVRGVTFVPGRGEALEVAPDGVIAWLGVPDACDDDVVRISAGTAMTAPMMKNTAAMITLGSCIASSMLTGHGHVRPR
ncbi:MAG TPA: hypothetical protein VNW94_15675 [Streptosporangiaceae bacterium]|nr:hypothetical protein [Streptosporangiaceae bacterium]